MKKKIETNCLTNTEVLKIYKIIYRRGIRALIDEIISGIKEGN
jgi:hypothetical protein